MRLLFAAAIAAAAIAPVQGADTAQQAAMTSCAATWKTMPAANKAQTKYTDYMSSCMKGPTPGASMTMSAKPAASAANAMKMTAPAPGASMTMTAKPAASAANAMKMTAPAEAGSAAK